MNGFEHLPERMIEFFIVEDKKEIFIWRQKSRRASSIGSCSMCDCVPVSFISHFFLPFLSLLMWFVWDNDCDKVRFNQLTDWRPSRRFTYFRTFSLSRSLVCIFFLCKSESFISVSKHPKQKHQLFRWGKHSFANYFRFRGKEKENSEKCREGGRERLIQNFTW